ncbi:MAG: peroxidase family protein [Mycobacterium leprae]
MGVLVPSQERGQRAGESALTSAVARLSTRVDRGIGWDKLPVPLGLLVLMGLRDALREYNLTDTYEGRPPPPPSAYQARDLTTRRTDGSYNDLGTPSMGMAGTRFGRNVPLDRTYPEQQPLLLTPNPRVVSRELLSRKAFIPAPMLNLLAAVWLQFETRDWFSHGTDPSDPILVPRPLGDDWPEEPIRIPRTPRDPSAAVDSGKPATFLNTESHWWDASQVYGSTPQLEQAIRSGEGGRVRIDANGFIDVDSDVITTSGGADGWWLGLELLHTLFMREHNAICDRLRAAYPSWSDDELFAKARLINAALIAKIHTVEWTTAILGHPTLQVAMRTNWWGLAMERVHDLVGRISTSDVISGIPGSETNHHTAPYSITEEFVAVYRMHQLIPDDFTFRSAADGTTLAEHEFLDLQGPSSHALLEQTPISDVIYSFGTSNPGAVTLHNHPRFMNQFRRTDGISIDLAAVDILRSRERGVPRYNEFRRLLRLKPAETFEALSDDPATVKALRRVYDGEVEKVDLSVGMYAERPPAGFGFSDTAFRIFILMASRRLKSDRFFTVDFTPRVYTPEGMQWIDDNDMSSVLLRHYPSLAPALRGARNAFAPWPGTPA